MTAFEPASRLFELEVQDPHGEFVGWVSELLMDLSRGQIEYILITLPSDRSRGASRVTVPWSVIRTDSRQREQWKVTVNKAAIEKLADVETDS